MQNKFGIFLFAVVFVFGVSIGSLFSFFMEEEIKPENEYKSTENFSTSEVSSFDKRILNLEQKSDSQINLIESINVKINHLLDLLQESGRLDMENSAEHVLTEENEEATHRGDASTDMIKGQIYTNLSDTSMTLPDILESNEMRSLPEDEKKEVLAEIARKIDSGELDKTQFLPGYKAP